MHYNVSPNEMKHVAKELGSSAEFKNMSRNFIGNLIEKDYGKAACQDFENDWKLRKNAEVFCYWN